MRENKTLGGTTQHIPWLYSDIIVLFSSPAITASKSIFSQGWWYMRRRKRERFQKGSQNHHSATIENGTEVRCKIPSLAARVFAPI
jgi:hypothetical protein